MKRLDERFKLINVPMIDRGLYVPRDTSGKSIYSLQMYDNSSFYRFLWHYLIFKANLSEEELQALEETCIKFSFYPIVTFHLLRMACDIIFQRGYLNSGLRDNHDFKIGKDGKEVPPQSRNYIENPIDDICCEVANSSFIITARATNEIGISVLEEMLEEAESKSEIHDPVKTITLGELEDKLVNQSPLLGDYLSREIYITSLEENRMEAVSMKLLDSAINLSSSGKFIDTVDINTGITMPCRVTDGEFIFTPSATKTIGVPYLSKMMADANNRAIAKENVRAKLN